MATCSLLTAHPTIRARCKPDVIVAELERRCAFDGATLVPPRADTDTYEQRVYVTPTQGIHIRFADVSQAFAALSQRFADVSHRFHHCLVVATQGFAALSQGFARFRSCEGVT